MCSFRNLTKAWPHFNKPCLICFPPQNHLVCDWCETIWFILIQPRCGMIVPCKIPIEHDPNKPMCDYLRQFLTGVAKSVGDAHLERAAQNEPIEDLG